MLELDRISALRPESIRRLGDSGSSIAPAGDSGRPSALSNTPRARRPFDLSPEALENEVQSRLNDLLQDVIDDGRRDRAIRVARDEASGRFVYSAVDIPSGEVIRQFPPEEILRLVRAVREAAGLVLDEDA